MASPESPLEHWRSENGKSQQELADLLGTTQATISRWETSVHEITPTHAIAIEAATGISKHVLRPDVFGKGNGAGEAA